ncbi:alpha/beta hydrolase [Microbacterium sp. 4R-513]|uniref:alpha/beta fold hydrolase n=1 Tax=Microbacterium sp. 4R-513 TaxID=2567934 RepID=UPI0013E18B77|nr:alpha/beta hydrolase [Microbacterium sp. 4R-513]QIG40022.1 alpha/beta hydrolase [Microbacterium sp. 4R-513]
MANPRATAATEGGAADLPPASGFRHRFLQTPGLTSHVAVVGEGEPVVMLHGLPQHWWQWRTIGAALGERYQVICPDLRGFGWTRADSPGMGRLTQMDDLLALLDALHLDRIRLVAHDLGAVTAHHLAYAEPERVQAMAILSVPPPFMPFSVSMLPAMRHIPPLLFHRRGRSIAHVFEPPYVVKRMPPETVATYLAPMQRPDIDAAINEVYRWLVFSEMPRMAAGSYRRQRLTVPTLYAFGAEDRPLTADFVRAQCGDLSRFAEHVEITEVPEAAHFMTDDNPQAVERTLRDFFERVG